MSWLFFVAGLHEGLGSLVAAGVPPRFLIIDDGWQCTDVDRRFRQPPTTRTVPRLSEIGEASDEFFDAELEVLSSAARSIPPSSSAGASPLACDAASSLILFWTRSDEFTCSLRFAYSW